MSEQVTNKKVFKITKTIPGDVLFGISPISNPNFSKEVYLTDRMPFANLPLDWALGVFLDDGLYTMYKKGCFTFDDNESLVTEAIAAGVYFDEVLDFTPASVEDVDNIFKVLQEGNRPNILKVIDQYGQEKVEAVAIKNAGKLTANVISMLEKLWNIQLIMDGSTD